MKSGQEGPSKIVLDNVIAKCYNKSLGRQRSAELFESYRSQSAERESYNRRCKMEEVHGLPKLLLAVADRMEGNIDGLNKELLLQSAAQIDALELVANVATRIVDGVPHAKSKGRIAAKVDYRLLVELMRALEAAGKHVKVLRI